MESKLLWGVTPVGYTEDDIVYDLFSEPTVIPPEVQHQVLREMQGFPYFWFFLIIVYIVEKVVFNYDKLF